MPSKKIHQLHLVLSFKDKKLQIKERVIENFRDADEREESGEWLGDNFDTFLSTGILHCFLLLGSYLWDLLHIKFFFIISRVRSQFQGRNSPCATQSTNTRYLTQILEQVEKHANISSKWIV